MAWGNLIERKMRISSSLFSSVNKAPHLFIFQVPMKHLFNLSCTCSEARETDDSAVLAIVVVTIMLVIVYLKELKVTTALKLH